VGERRYGWVSTLRDMVIGCYALKGVPGEWHLFAVASA
jgi:hypothetical protein